MPFDRLRANGGLSKCASPRFQFSSARKRSIRRAGRWQTRQAKRCIAEQRQDITTKAGLGHCAIEKHIRDFRMRRKERVEVIRDNRIVADIGVQAAFPFAARQHIPHSNARCLQRCGAGTIRQCGISANQRAHDAPESILRMRVILPCIQRGLPRHAAENQDARLAVFYRRETANRCHDYLVQSHCKCLTASALAITSSSRLGDACMNCKPYSARLMLAASMSCTIRSAALQVVGMNMQGNTSK
jgi:hypothetical protein